MPSLDGLVARQLSLEVWHYVLISEDKGCYASFTRRMNATLLSLRAFISVFISQLLSFNYFNHLVHSSVASLFNLEYILTCMLQNCFHFFLPCQFTTSKFIPSHMWRSCTPEHATSAAAVIFSLIFKLFSIFFYPLNCSLSNSCLFTLLILFHTSVHI